MAERIHRMIPYSISVSVELRKKKIILKLMIFFPWKTMLFLLGWNCYKWNAYIHVKYFFHFNLWHIFGIVVSNKVVKLTILSFPSWTLIVLILNRMIPDSSSVGVELSETRSSTWQAFYVKVIGLVLRGNTMMEMLPFTYTNWIM